MPLEQRQPERTVILVPNPLGLTAFKITIPAVKISGNCTTPSFSDDDSITPMTCLSTDETLETPALVLSKEDLTDDISFLDSLASEDILSPVLEDEAELGDFLVDLF